MRRLLLLLALTLLLPAVVAADERTPVLIELFTSEGCSSCPPADAYVAQLVRTQPLKGVRIVALSEHVDYWNSLGWTDPFSSPEFSQRQRRYARQLGSGVYTPQVVIDGSVDQVGNQRDEVLTSIYRAAKQPKVTLDVSARWTESGKLDIQVGLSDAPDGLDGPFILWTAIAEDGLVVDVPRGENGGRVLKHDGVARRLGDHGKIRPGQARAIELEVHAKWDRQALRLVAFLEKPADGRIVGLAGVELSEIDSER